MTAFAKPGVDVSLIQDQARTAQAKSVGKAQAQGGKSAIRSAAEEFESVFIAQMLKPMFKGVESSGMFGGGPGEDIYKGLMVEEYGKAISRAGGIGIADQVQSELLKIQEAANR